MGGQGLGAVQISNERFEKLLRSLDETVDERISPERTLLRERVALLSAFDPDTLDLTVEADRLVHSTDDSVGDDFVPVVTRRGHQWSLRDDIRVQTLADLDRQGRLHRFEGLTADDDVACLMARLYIRGEAPDLKDQTIEQLQGTAFASDWLQQTSVTVPSATEARSRQAIEAVLQPMRQLVAQGFVGRTSELEQLADYVEVLPPSRRAKGVVRRIRQVLRMSEQPPLLIFGPGGVGKSTLMARFVLDHVDSGDEYRFPFAYLTFDREELRIDVPMTLLADAATQLGAIFPKVSDDAAVLSQTARAAVATELAGSHANRALQSSVDVTSRASIQDEQILLDRFATLVERATGTRDLPLLWVLDTFEVAQRRSPAGVDRLWDFLDRFQRACPHLRVVICGRARIPGRATRELPLEELDQTAAHELLRMQLADLHLPDSFLGAIAGSAATSPVSLRVAVIFVRSEAARGLASEERQRDVLLRLRSNEVHGVLYRRFLDHIDNLEVRSLAHPGLVTRRITRALIQDVLAGLCGIQDIDEVKAHTLFDALRREVSLVEPDGADGLKQRPELRRVMLPMIVRDEPELVAKVRRACLRYFRKRSDPGARVEELYYRLALGQSSVTLDRAFDVDAARTLIDDIDELPPGSRVYLWTRLGLTADPDLLAQADDLAWARQTALTARRFLDAGDPNTALEQLSGRSGDHVIPLTAPLQIEAHATLRQFDEALAVASSALAWATSRGDAGAFIDIGLIAARVAEDADQPNQAMNWLRDVKTAATTLDDFVASCSAQVGMLRLHRRQGSTQSHEARSLRADLIEATKHLTARDRDRNPWLVRDLAAEIGDSVPAITRAALRLRGVSDDAALPKKKRRRRDLGATPTLYERGQMQSDTFDESRSEDISSAFKAESDENAF